mgnify:CR=1 FL=1
MFYIPFVVLLIILIAIIMLKAVKIVPESQVYIVEKLGKYYQSLSSGLNFINPFFDRVSRIVSLKEQVVDFDPQAVITKDNATMQIDTVVYFQITDPKLYTYGVERPLSAIENLTATTLRNIIGDMTVDETLTSRDIINTKMRQELDVPVVSLTFPLFAKTGMAEIVAKARLVASTISVFRILYLSF